MFLYVILSQTNSSHLYFDIVGMTLSENFNLRNKLFTLFSRVEIVTSTKIWWWLSLSGVDCTFAEIANVIAAYQATGQEQLSLMPGQLIQVRKKSNSGWWEGELQVTQISF